MSLDVTPALLDAADHGPIDPNRFTDCIRTSLPYAWATISGLVEEFRGSSAPFADNTVPPPDEQARGQLLRVLASDSIRSALERHFGVTLAFQNCHRLAVFAATPDPAVYQDFTSPRAQILNQTPELRNC